jgi:hypothetical protein
MARRFPQAKMTSIWPPAKYKPSQILIFAAAPLILLMGSQACAPHFWLIKHWFSASTFVVKIATFTKPETVLCYFKRLLRMMENNTLKVNLNKY